MNMMSEKERLGMLKAKEEAIKRNKTGSVDEDGEEQK
jgi:hypothetical protein